MSDITMLCPCCSGSNVAKFSGLKCTVCNGDKTATIESALSYADLLSRLAADYEMSGFRPDGYGLDAMRTDAAAIREQAERIKRLASM